MAKAKVETNDPILEIAKLIVGLSYRDMEVLGDQIAIIVEGLVIEVGIEYDILLPKVMDKLFHWAEGYVDSA